MENGFNRRNFLKSAGIGSCVLLLASAFKSSGSLSLINFDNQIPDPKKLNYCGYKCPENCQMLKATIENNADLKMKAYSDFEVKKIYGIDFDADKVFCWGCKAKAKPEGILVSNCKVKMCAQERGFDCCIECNELTSCNKDLWKKYPEHYEKVVEMHKKYMSSKK